MKIIKTKGKVFIDGQKAKWCTIDRALDSSWRIRYQLLDKDEVKTEYYSTAFQKKTPKGTKETVELVQRIEQLNAELVWDRQVKRGVIV